MTWRDRFRRLYRRLFNRCTLCGAAREPVSGDVYTQGPFCRKHNKLFIWGSAYGMGPTTFEKFARRIK